MATALEDQLAEERRQRAEAEQPEPEPEPEPGDDDDEEGEEGEGDGQVEPESAAPTLSPEEVERAFKQAEKVSARYEAQLAKALGPIFQDLLPSPLDDVPGYVFPFDPNTEVGDFKRASVAAYFGDDVPPLKDNPDSAACVTCEGWGEVLSGAKNALHRVVACPRCGGTGWQPKQGAAPPPQYQPVPGEIVPQSLNANGQEQPQDAFERPWGHPHYGEIPKFTGDN